MRVNRGSTMQYAGTFTFALQHGRYLEDHTGFADLGPEDFEERRKFFESPDFDWYKQRLGARVSAACVENI